MPAAGFPRLSLVRPTGRTIDIAFDTRCWRRGVRLQGGGKFDRLTICQYNELIVTQPVDAQKGKDIQVKICSLTTVFLMAILSAAHLNAQQIYTWTDENGVTHITDQAPPQKSSVQNVIEYKAKPPQEQEAIERQKQQMQEQYRRFEKRKAARQTAIEAREADQRAQEAFQKAQQETTHNQEYLQRLSNRKWKRKQFRKKIERIKNETEAAQNEAKAAAEQAEAAAKKAQQAAADEAQTQ